jgi:hypothetical protein
MISDLTKTFLEASSRSHEIAYILEAVIEHEDLVSVLTRATPLLISFSSSL